VKIFKKKKKYPEQERRKYIRLNSVFPVQFRLLGLDGKRFLSDWLQGFTSNVSKGGICLCVNNLNPELAKILKEKQAKLFLDIEMPLAREPVAAQGSVAWVKDEVNEPNKYVMGIAYDEIDGAANSRIMRHARTRKLLIPLFLSAIIILGSISVFNTIVGARLIQGNKVLIQQLIRILQESSIAKQKVKEITKEKQDLQVKILTLHGRIQTAEEEKKRLDTAKTDEVNQLNSLIGELLQEKGLLQEALISVQHKENKITEDLLRLDKRKVVLAKANLDKMYQWLKTHQNPRTGLVMSFEGDKDISNWAFVYDQALVAQAYTYFADYERARKIIHFFYNKAKRIDGKFLNAYYVNDGSPAEYVVHSGPNIWLGIAVVQYAKKSNDFRYLPLAEEIAQFIINLQERDSEGGIVGGPNVNWYSTEHNLDAYSFLNMLYKLAPNPEYLKARDKVLNWLVEHTYSKLDIPIKRGKGDSTIATDTYAWSIAAIGPEKLCELGMNPDRILEFAEQNCAIDAGFVRTDGTTVKVKGFDFAPERHVSRGGVVSSEWTAQMVLAYKIMADYYYNKKMIAKYRTYEGKADMYLAELANMVIISPSPSGQGGICLPYATQDFVDTGHGWMTPKGKSTGSVSGTAYTLFAHYNYNPLELQE